MMSLSTPQTGLGLQRTAMAVAIVLVVGLVLSAGPARAGTIDSYCSPTGDFCTAVTKRDGRVKLELATFSFQDYAACVRGPAGKKCIDRHMDADGGDLFSDRIDVARKFAADVPGRYKAAWKFEGSRIGPPLHFRVR